MVARADRAANLAPAGPRAPRTGDDPGAAAGGFAAVLELAGSEPTPRAAAAGDRGAPITENAAVSLPGADADRAAVEAPAAAKQPAVIGAGAAPASAVAASAAHPLAASGPDRGRPAPLAGAPGSLVNAPSAGSGAAPVAGGAPGALSGDQPQEGLPQNPLAGDQPEGGPPQAALADDQPLVAGLRARGPVAGTPGPAASFASRNQNPSEQPVVTARPPAGASHPDAPVPGRSPAAAVALAGQTSVDGAAPAGVGPAGVGRAPAPTVPTGAVAVAAPAPTVPTGAAAVAAPPATAAAAADAVPPAPGAGPAQAAVPPAPAAAVAVPPAPGPGPAPAPAAQGAVALPRAVETVEAVIRLASERGATRVRMSLRPAELGGVEVRLHASAAGLTARIVADHPQAAHVLQQAGAELRRSLEDQGVHLLRLDFETAGDRRADGRASPEDRPGGERGRPASTAPEAEPSAQNTGETAIRLPNGALVDVLA